MGSREKRAALLVGIVVIVVLVLALFLVPAIAAVSQVGHIDIDDPETCYMLDPTTHPISPTLPATSVRVSESNNQEYPDMNAVMRCEAQIDNYDGPAFTASGSRNVNCVIEFPADPPAVPNPEVGFTEKWQQTVSSSGNAVLSCHFQK